MTRLLLLAACQVISVTAQLCLKTGVARTRGALLSNRTAWRAALQPLLWTGAGLYAAATVLWVRILATTDLSYAYPFAAVSYVGGVLASQRLLREKVGAERWAGVGLILLGLVFVAFGGASTGR